MSLCLDFRINYFSGPFASVHIESVLFSVYNISVQGGGGGGGGGGGREHPEPFEHDDDRGGGGGCIWLDYYCGQTRELSRPRARRRSRPNEGVVESARLTAIVVE